MMKVSRVFGLTIFGIALFGAGAAPADELPPAADPLQQREQMRERVRAMTPEEQRLMRESSVDGRARMENRQSADSEGRRRGGGEGGGYGQGYESRRGDRGGGRGMGGGRNR